MTSQGPRWFPWLVRLYHRGFTIGLSGKKRELVVTVQWPPMSRFIEITVEWMF